MVVCVGDMLFQSEVVSSEQGHGFCPESAWLSCLFPEIRLGLGFPAQVPAQALGVDRAEGRGCEVLSVHLSSERLRACWIEDWGQGFEGGQEPAHLGSSLSMSPLSSSKDWHKEAFVVLGNRCQNGVNRGVTGRGRTRWT